MSLFEKISAKVYTLKGVDVETVIEAEKKLGLKFSSEFRNYLIEYGCASFGSHEFMGLGSTDYLDVVKETLNERRNSDRFPRHCYILENLGIDGIFILQDEEGSVYELNDAGMKKIFGSFQEYMESLQ